jgi:hypothetical protein
LRIKGSLNFGEYLIEIASIKLKHPRLPIFAFQITVQYSICNSIKQNIFVEVKRNKLLTVTVLFWFEGM